MPDTWSATECNKGNDCDQQKSRAIFKIKTNFNYFPRDDKPLEKNVLKSEFS